MSPPMLRGPGIALRPLTVEDAPALFLAHGDPDVHVYWATPAHASVEETRAYILDTIAKSSAQTWAITENGGVALGRIALMHPREGVGEIGIILRRDAHGAGLASRALKLVMAHA